MSNDVLRALGIKKIDRIEQYSVRSESKQDILKIYYKK
ncbi:MAG: hypothetical protein ACJA0C_000539 [Candidatus Endobugula sp.]|jgi:hypothetical protein